MNFIKDNKKNISYLINNIYFERLRGKIKTITAIECPQY